MQIIRFSTKFIAMSAFVLGLSAVSVAHAENTDKKQSASSNASVSTPLLLAQHDANALMPITSRKVNDVGLPTLITDSQESQFKSLLVPGAWIMMTGLLGILRLQKGKSVKA